MIMHRKIIIAAIAVVSCNAMAQEYPNKAIRLIMPYPIGGSIDIAGRMVAQRLADNLGQAVVVDNRTGAGSTTGIDSFAKSPADG